MTRRYPYDSGTFEKQGREKIAVRIRALPPREFRRFRRKVAAAFVNGAVERVLTNLDLIREGHMKDFIGDYAEDVMRECEQHLPSNTEQST